jgi:hypothetical protein
VREEVTHEEEKMKGKRGEERRREERKGGRRGDRKRPRGTRGRESIRMGGDERGAQRRDAGRE